MSIGVMLLIFLTVIVVIGGGIAALGYFSTDSRALRAANKRASIATKALRSIANGAGNPIFEAQDALDQIESTTYKELN